MKIFLNKDEAKYYAKLYNACVYPIKSNIITEDVTFTDDTFVEHLFDPHFIAEIAYKMMYIVAVEKECALDENMLPIKHIIYVKKTFKKSFTV